MIKKTNCNIQISSYDDVHKEIFPEDSCDSNARDINFAIGIKQSLSSDSTTRWICWGKKLSKNLSK